MNPRRLNEWSGHLAEQAGPLMRRHIIDGHEVFLPCDAVLAKRLDPNRPLCPLCIGEGGSAPFAREVWICGECGGTGQL